MSNVKFDKNFGSVFVKDRMEVFLQRDKPSNSICNASKDIFGPEREW